MSLSFTGSDLGTGGHDPDGLIDAYRSVRAQETLFEVRDHEPRPGAFGATGYDEFIDSAG